jgi:hypothetical protein
MIWSVYQLSLKERAIFHWGNPFLCWGLLKKYFVKNVTPDYYKYNYTKNFGNKRDNLKYNTITDEQLY